MTDLKKLGMSNWEWVIGDWEKSSSLPPLPTLPPLRPLLPLPPFPCSLRYSILLVGQ